MKVNDPTKLKFPLTIINKKQEILYKKLWEREGYITGYRFANGKSKPYPYKLHTGISNKLIQENLE